MNFQDRRSSLLLDMTYHELLLPHCLDVGICPAEFDLLSQLAISLLQLLLLDFSLAGYFLPTICYDAQDRAALPWGWQIPLAGPPIPARMPPSMMYIVWCTLLWAEFYTAEQQEWRGKYLMFQVAALSSIKLRGKQQLEKPRKQLLENYKGQRWPWQGLWECSISQQIIN